MKIYMVRINNADKYDRTEVNVCAFWSKTKAIDFMHRIDDEATKANRRIYELDKIGQARELTKTEQRERDKLWDVWTLYAPGESSIWIEEIDVY